MKSLKKAIATQPEISAAMLKHVKACPFGDEFCHMKILRAASLRRTKDISKRVTKITG